ncbi:hypothetical protein EBB07_10990 [Paenibacillaceae bacterium]|nr:hypothetical protein EBB07_10990 [Paenibacillaceae bacterium]
MIDKQISIVDLNPYTWRNLGQLTSGFQKQVIYVLHDQGKVLSIARSGNQLLQGETFQVTDSANNAQALLAAYPDIDEVQVLERQRLIQYYIDIQSLPVRELDTDEYLLQMEVMLRNYSGIEVYSREQTVHYFEKLQQYVQAKLPENCILLLFLLSGDAISFDLLLEFNNHRIVRMSSTERFHQEKEVPSFADITDIMNNVQTSSELPVVLEIHDFNAFRAVLGSK